MKVLHARGHIQEDLGGLKYGNSGISIVKKLEEASTCTEFCNYKEWRIQSGIKTSNQVGVFCRRSQCLSISDEFSCSAVAIIVKTLHGDHDRALGGSKLPNPLSLVDRGLCPGAQETAEAKLGGLQGEKARGAKLL
jgi:hypothetical protein